MTWGNIRLLKPDVYDEHLIYLLSDRMNFDEWVKHLRCTSKLILFYMVGIIRLIKLYYGALELDVICLSYARSHLIISHNINTLFYSIGKKLLNYIKYKKILI